VSLQLVKPSHSWSALIQEFPREHWNWVESQTAVYIELDTVGKWAIYTYDADATQLNWTDEEAQKGGGIWVKKLPKLRRKLRLISKIWRDRSHCMPYRVVLQSNTENAENAGDKNAGHEIAREERYTLFRPEKITHNVHFYSKTSNVSTQIRKKN